MPYTDSISDDPTADAGLSRKAGQSAALAFLLMMTAGILALATWFDIVGGFVYVPRIIVAIVGSLLVLPIAGVIQKPALACSVAILAIVLGLAQVRWNTLKSFYIDAYSLRAGVTIEEVRERMGPYLEFGQEYASNANDPRESSNSQIPDAPGRKLVQATSLSFVPDEAHSADMCIIHLENGRVAHVEISPD